MSPRPLRLLRVTHDYWPSTGGNETWNARLDGWFSRVAGDHVRTLVLRRQGGELYRKDRPPVQPTPLDVPGATHEVFSLPFYTARGKMDQVRQYRAVTGLFITDDVDVVQTQIANHYAIPAWRTRRLALEPEEMVACEYGQHATCPRRGALHCPTCAPLSRPAQWLRGELRLAVLARAHTVAQNASVIDDVTRAGFGSKAFMLRHITSPDDYDAAPSDEMREAFARIEALHETHERVVMQVNRLISFKNPRRLLDLFRSDPRVAIVFGGDGPEREPLEAEVARDPALRGRVLFLGSVPNRQVRPLLALADATLLTSDFSNHNTSLFEALCFSGGPVFATDVGDFPEALRPMTHFAPLAPDDDEARRQIDGVLSDASQVRALREHAQAYIHKYHGYGQLVDYRNRLMSRFSNLN